MATMYRAKRGLKKELPIRDNVGTFLFAEDTKELYIAGKESMILLNRKRDVNPGYFGTPEDANVIDGGEF